jgi:hypothetical protein
LPDLSDQFEPSPPSPPLDPAAVKFYSGALDRIRRIMGLIGVAAAAVVWWRYGTALALGLAAGCAISYVNFFWLKQAVGGLLDRVDSSGKRQPAGGIVARFLLRYALIALGGYAIFRVSLTALYGLLGGLFLTVAAILCEAMYEVWVALRRGF